MEIHELPTGTLSSTDYIPIDNGSATRKVNYGAQMDALNGAVTAATGTFLSSASVTIGTNTTLTKINGVVYFNIDASTSANIATGSAGAGFITFPSGFRPGKAKDFIGRNGAGSYSEFYVTTNGQMQCTGGISSGSTFRVSGCFTI